MRRIWSLLLIVCLCSVGIHLSAQQIFEDDMYEDDTDEDINWIDFVHSPYTAGDQNFILSLGALAPLVFIGEIENNEHGISLGAMGSLSYNYFLNGNFFLGGEIAGSFSGTRGANMLYIVPFGVRFGYQFLYRRFEIPLTLMVGAAGQRYLDKGYFGPFLKPGASMYWRYNMDFSFGLNVNWWFVPQWPKNEYSVYGNFLELTLSLRYHI